MRRRSVSDSRYDVDRDLERKRREWAIRQQKEREHEKRKQKLAEKWEREHAEELARLREMRKRARQRSRSRSPGRSEEHRNHSKNHSTDSKPVMSQRLNKSEGNKPFFKGPEESKKIDTEELRKITVKIERHIPSSAIETNEIRREVINPEEIVLNRRDGEGLKPIFDREEIKQNEAKVEIEERRVIASTDNSSAKKVTGRRRSKSVSPRRHRSPSPRHRSSSRSHSSRKDSYNKRHSEDRHYNDYKSNRRRSSERPRSRDDSRRLSSPRRRSHSRDRDYHRSDRDYSRSSSRNEKNYRSERGRSLERSYDRLDINDRSRERHLPPMPYVGHMPYPVYYGPYPPRPMPMGPPMRGPMIRGPSMPGISAPMPLPGYPPRFVGPQDMYRFNLPSDTRRERM